MFFSTLQMGVRRCILALAAFSAFWTPTTVGAEDAAIEVSKERPQISSFARLPFPVKVPQTVVDAKNKGEPVPYDRTLPILGRELAQKGYVFPNPYGLTVFSVYNEQVNVITDLAIALGLNAPPPPGTPLVDLPFVTIGETESFTTNTQLKLDAWVLPFLNVFIGKGRLNGHVDMTVKIDLDAFLPGPLCPPQNPCGTAEWSFTPKVDGQIYTIGGTFVYSEEPWFTSLNASYSWSTEESRTDITTYTLGARAGRFWQVSRGLTISAYAGASYQISDNVIEGSTSAPGTLPGGSTLDLNYSIHQRNRDRWVGLAGLNFDVKRNVGVQVEASFARGTKRGMISAYVRF